MADNLELKLTRGDTKTFEFTVTKERTKAVWNLASHTAWFTAKRKITDLDAEAVFQKTSAAGDITFPDAANGRLDVKVEPADTSSLTKDEVLLWDLQIKDASSNVYTVASGTLRVSRDVTITS